MTVSEYSNDSRGTTSMTAANPWGFRFAAIEIRIEESSPFLDIAAQRLVDELAHLPGVESVRYLGTQGMGQEMRQAPDLLITLSLAKPLEVETTLKETRIAASVVVHTRSGLLPFVSSDRSEYLNDWTLEHTSTTEILKSHGVSVPHLRSAADNVGKVLGKSMRDGLSGVYKKNGLAPRMDKNLLPVPKKAPSLPWPEGSQPELQSQFYGFESSNQTTWSLVRPESVEDFVAEFQKRLEADGWKKCFEQVHSILGMERGDEGLQILLREDDKKASVVYGLKTSSAELQDCFDRLDPTTTDKRWLLEARAPVSASLRRRVLADAKSAAPGDWMSWWLVAQLQHEDDTIGPEEVALSAKRAAIYAWAADDSDRLSRDWTRASKNWGLSKDLPRSFSKEELQDSGMPKLAVGETITCQVRVDEPFFFLGENRSGNPQACELMLTFKRLDDSSEPPTLKLQRTWRDTKGGSFSTLQSVEGKGSGERGNLKAVIRGAQSSSYPSAQFTITELEGKSSLFEIDVLGL